MAGGPGSHHRLKILHWRKEVFTVPSTVFSIIDPKEYIPNRLAKGHQQQVLASVNRSVPGSI
jgi:hypothetical protein